MNAKKKQPNKSFSRDASKANNEDRIYKIFKNSWIDNDFLAHSHLQSKSQMSSGYQQFVKKDIDLRSMKNSGGEAANGSVSALEAVPAEAAQRHARNRRVGRLRQRAQEQNAQHPQIRATKHLEQENRRRPAQLLLELQKEVREAQPHQPRRPEQARARRGKRRDCAREGRRQPEEQGLGDSRVQVQQNPEAREPGRQRLDGGDRADHGNQATEDDFVEGAAADQHDRWS